MFQNMFATCLFYRDKYVKASVRDRIPQSGHSCTVFHVSALEQLMADCSVDAINKIVKEISAHTEIELTRQTLISCPMKKLWTSQHSVVKTWGSA